MANGGNMLTSQADCEELWALLRKLMECDTLMSAGSKGCPFSDNLGSWPNVIKLGRTHDLFHGVLSMVGFSEHLLYVWASKPLWSRRCPHGPEYHHHPATVYRRVGHAAAT